MKVCQRKPIYKSLTTHLYIPYSFYKRDGTQGKGSLTTTIKHKVNQDPLQMINYGSVIRYIKETMILELKEKIHLKQDILDCETVIITFDSPVEIDEKYVDNRLEINDYS